MFDNKKKSVKINYITFTDLTRFVIKEKIKITLYTNLKTKNKHTTN